jgi:hypothetical protein
MDCCNLSSTGLQDIDANDIIADNITILSRLNVSGITNLHNSLNDVVLCLQCFCKIKFNVDIAETNAEVKQMIEHIM